MLKLLIATLDLQEVLILNIKQFWWEPPTTWSENQPIRYSIT
jgi:hypothetical protein